MPFDANRAKHILAAAMADAQGPDQEEESRTARAVSAPAPAAAPVNPPATAGRFQRPSAPAPASAPVPAPEAGAARRFQRDAVPPAAAPAPAAGSTNRFQRDGQHQGQGRAYVPPGQQTRAPTSAPAMSAPSPSPAPRPPMGEQQPPVSSDMPAPKGYGTRVGPARQTSMKGLTPRLELYIDDLAFNLGWTKDDVERRKREAIQKPQEAENTYRGMFEQIRQKRAQTVASLSQGMRDHPGMVVFATRRNENEPGQFSALSPEEAGDLRILHGSAFHSMPASATLFNDPATVFAPKAAVAAPVVEDMSDLEDDDVPVLAADAPAPASAPRPVRSARP